MRPIEVTVRDNERIRELCQALMNCADDGELMLSLLRDLFAVHEIEQAANRLAAAIRLEAGGTVRATARDLGIAPATVSRMRQWVRNGTGGVEAALSRRRKSGDAVVDNGVGEV